MKVKEFLKELLSWILNIGVAILVALAINIFVFQITSVSGQSMMQTLKDGDTYITVKFGKVFGSYPKHSDIVVIDSRVSVKRSIVTDISDIYNYNIVRALITGSQPSDYWVKRVIGLPGDSIKTDPGGFVYRNGEKLEEPYVNPTEQPRYHEEEYEVPDGYVFVMGDNRNHSSDSRVIGLVPIENVMGVVKFKVKSGK